MLRSHRANFSCACDCAAAIVARVGSKRSTRSIVGVRLKSNFEFSPSFVISDSLCQALATAFPTCHPSALAWLSRELSVGSLQRSCGRQPRKNGRRPTAWLLQSCFSRHGSWDPPIVSDKVVIVHGLRRWYERRGVLRQEGQRVSRHYYDLHCLFRSGVGRAALAQAELGVDCPDYDLASAAPGSFAIAPTAGSDLWASASAF